MDLKNIPIGTDTEAEFQQNYFVFQIPKYIYIYMLMFYVFLYAHIHFFTLALDINA